MTHNNREPIEQNRHDTIIGRLYEQFLKEGKKVKTNEGSTKLNGVKNEGDTEAYYPDVFIIGTGTKVIEIYEVETENTTNENSIEQWKKSSEDTAKFFLVVPKESLKTAKELAEKHKIPVEEYFVF